MSWDSRSYVLSLGGKQAISISATIHGCSVKCVMRARWSHLQVRSVAFSFSPGLAGPSERAGAQLEVLGMKRPASSSAGPSSCHVYLTNLVSGQPKGTICGFISTWVGKTGAWIPSARLGLPFAFLAFLDSPFNQQQVYFLVKPCPDVCFDERANYGGRVLLFPEKNGRVSTVGRFRHVHMAFSIHVCRNIYTYVFHTES